LTFYLAETFGCQVTSVTPSPVQAAYLRERGHERVKVIERSVYDLGDLTARSFDAIALVGVIEHMPDHHSVLRTAARVLRKEGRLYLSASCYRNRKAYEEHHSRPGSRYVSDDIFGFIDLRPFSCLVEAVEDAGLSVLGFADLTVDYHRTVADWLSGVRAGRDVIESYRAGYADELIRYMEITNAGWGQSTKHYALTATRSRWGHPDALR
jgi:cyclopropane-fatty-acyl-phospholipid synthase